MSIKRLIEILLAMAVIGCADVGPPPGGPEDKQGPVVLRSEPLHGAVNLSAVRYVEIELSEQILVPKGSSVLISPRPKNPPKVSWRGRAVKIEFADTLPANKTYIVSLPAAMGDLRGNKPDTAIALAFSTGPTLDSGSISGRIIAQDKPVAGVTVALYDEQKIKPGTIYDSMYPDYLTTTGTSGRYVFRYLPSARFRMISFQKSGRDDRFRPVRDKFALPDHPIDLTVDPVITDLDLWLTSQDTLPVRIISGLIDNDRILQLRLSRPIRREALGLSNEMELSIGGTRHLAHAYFPPDSESVASVAAYFGPLTAGIGRISWEIDKSRAPLVFDSLRIPLYGDSTPPRQTSVVPGDRPVLTPDTAVHLRFSEPIDTLKLTDTSVVIRSLKDSARIPCERIIPNPFELVFRPRALAAGESYGVTILESELFDLAGNTAGDSVRQARFSIVHPDSLGWIEGTVQTEASDSAVGVGLGFRKLADGQEFRFANAPRGFKFALPAGKYLVTGFVDRNANGRFDAGLVFPYTYSEPFLPFSDTVSVRARFETAGVELEFK